MTLSFLNRFTSTASRPEASGPSVQVIQARDKLNLAELDLRNAKDALSDHDEAVKYDGRLATDHDTRRALVQDVRDATASVKLATRLLGKSLKADQSRGGGATRKIADGKPTSLNAFEGSLGDVSDIRENSKRSAYSPRGPAAGQIPRSATALPQPGHVDKIGVSARAGGPALPHAQTSKAGGLARASTVIDEVYQTAAEGTQRLRQVAQSLKILLSGSAFQARVRALAAAPTGELRLLGTDVTQAQTAYAAHVGLTEIVRPLAQTDTGLTKARDRLNTAANLPKTASDRQALIQAFGGTESQAQAAFHEKLGFARALFESGVKIFGTSTGISDVWEDTATQGRKL